jgi:2-polyprenyl-6-methoxyphenol hydroxylase-like FAD-dependent oxidoreductase
MLDEQKWIDSRCDVAVFGAGPVGSQAAAMLTAADRTLRVKVLDKRPIATRDHSLRMAKDSVDTARRACNGPLARQPNAHIGALRELDGIFAQWRGRPVRTSKIETSLAAFNSAHGTPTRRDARCAVTADSLHDWLNATQAHVVIGADGAKSAMRRAIGARRLNEKPLGYLLELKYSVRADLSPRTSSMTSAQVVKAEGWDFETASQPEPGKNEKRFTLHKFIDAQTHAALLEERDGITKGGTEHPWTMAELGDLAQRRAPAGVVYRHIQSYLADYGLEPGDFRAERIVTFPMTLFRSSRTAKNAEGQVVVLCGDANSGVVLERGANKGLMEATACAQATLAYLQTLKSAQATSASAAMRPTHATLRYLHKPSRGLDALDLVGMPQVRSQPPTPACVDAALPARRTGSASTLPARWPLPKAFANYSAQTRTLYLREKWWAEKKAWALGASEVVIKWLVRPFKAVWWVVQGTSRLAAASSRADSMS